MAFKTDYSQINAADTPGNWTTSGFDSPQLNDISSTATLYIEGSEAMWWPLKKGQTNGYTYCSASGSLTGKVLVALIDFTLSAISVIPITKIAFRISSSSGFTTNYGEWDALAQFSAPRNNPVGMIPFMAYPTNPDASNGTPNYGSLASVGWVCTSGNDNDGKDGGFDAIFMIGYVGGHSATYSGTFFDTLTSECYDSDGGGIPDTADRPLFVFTGGNGAYKSNVSIQFGSGGTPNDTATTDVTETNGALTLANIEPEQEISLIFANPTTGECRVNFTDYSFNWISQEATHEIFKTPNNADHFKFTGCSFSNGGKIGFPADSANRWMRGGKFTNCQSGTASNGECTSTTFSGSNGAMVVSGDADFTGSSFLTPAVAADAAGLVWNGNYDPDGNLDNMTFSKGTNAHHAIEFGISTPTTMTVRNVDFSGFNATDAQNDSTLHIKRTSGTVTINLIGCTGNISYKSAGATVNLVVSPVTTLVHVDDNTGASLQNARVYMEAADGTGPLPYQDSVTITRAGTTATVSHTTHGMNSNEFINLDGITDKTEDNNGAQQITVTGANAYTYVTTDSGSTSYTGTITATGVLLHGLTDVDGDISISRTYGSNQPIAGNVRKSSSTPYFKTFELAGNTIDSTNGLSINVRMILD